MSDMDRYAMEILARILRDKISEGVMSYDDLYQDEDIVIDKIRDSEQWQRFINMNKVERSDIRKGEQWLKIEAKKRYIDPLVMGQGRISRLSESARKDLNSFINQSFDYYLKGN